MRNPELGARARPVRARRAAARAAALLAHGAQRLSRGGGDVGFAARDAARSFYVPSGRSERRSATRSAAGEPAQGAMRAVGVDATSWVNRRGYGRFARNAVGRLVAARPGRDYVFVIDEETAPQQSCPSGAARSLVALSRPPAERRRRGLVSARRRPAAASARGIARTVRRAPLPVASTRSSRRGRAEHRRRPRPDRGRLPGADASEAAGRARFWR